MSFEPVISVKKLSKCHHIYRTPQDRLKQFLWRGRRQFYREFWALHDVSFDVYPGEVIGIVGKNGSGKSTLLQLVCGTLTPSSGSLMVKGRVAALLELGAGFNPEFTGRENVYMSAAVLGLSEQEIAQRYEEIVDFSEIREFIDQPVKTYSSGMFVRLAFAVATSVDADILVIDEALSVGDGAFAYKSFNRIMQMRDTGKTILFCSHGLFQIESICSRTIWLNKGEVVTQGESSEVVAAYQGFLDNFALQPSPARTNCENSGFEAVTVTPVGHALLGSIEVTVDGDDFKKNPIVSGVSTLVVKSEFSYDSALPAPSLAVTLHAMDGRTITSTATWEDEVQVSCQNGQGCAQVFFERLPLLKGSYLLSVHLMCHQGLHVYDSANGVATLQVQQKGRVQGYFSIPHQWITS